MTMKFNKPIALLLAVTMAMLLSFPSREIIGLGLTADAATIEPSAPTLTTGVYNLDGDDATDDEVYEISTREELYWFAGLVNGTLENVTQNTSANAVLTENITVNTGDVAGCEGTPEGGWVDWTPIGNDEKSYTGTFDGRNHTISGLYFNHEGTGYGGLFGYMESGGSVSNVGVINSYINGGGYAGGVCGYNDDGAITNCYNSGTVSGDSSTGWFVGGVCGGNYGTITKCYNTGAVSGGEFSNYVGGVCGYNYFSGIISDCYNTGAVSVGDNGDYVGGLCGDNENIIVNCYNTGTVSVGNNGDYVGGVCGYKGNNDTIDNCYYLDT